MATRSNTNPLSILTRLIDPETGDIGPEAAECLLKINFKPADADRMRQLSLRASEGNLTPSEQAEIDSYNYVGDFLSLLHSKARQSLKLVKSLS
jgi:hypothetical protein